MITGGNYDVDLVITSPGKRILYKDVKKQYDSFTWTSDVDGEYQFCFSNEFSTFTHKLVYFDFQVILYITEELSVCVCVCTCLLALKPRNPAGTNFAQRCKKIWVRLLSTVESFSGHWQIFSDILCARGEAARIFDVDFYCMAIFGSGRISCLTLIR